MFLKIQKNDLFQIAQKIGIDPIQLSIHDNTEKDILAIYIKDTRYTFQILIKHDSFNIYSRPMVIYQVSTSKFSQQNQSWNSVIEHYTKWIKIVKKDLDAPDLWNDFKDSVKQFAPTEDAPNEKFTNDEIRQLQFQLRTLSSNIAQSNLPQSAQKALISTINQAPEKAERFTKKEWQAWFLGAIVAQVTNLTLTQEHVAAIYQMLKSAFITLLAQ